MDLEECETHTGQQKEWQCQECRKWFCDRGITSKGSTLTKVSICQNCGGRCVNRKEKQVEKKTFEEYTNLRNAFMYPLHGRSIGLILLVPFALRFFPVLFCRLFYDTFVSGHVFLVLFLPFLALFTIGLLGTTSKAILDAIYVFSVKKDFDSVQLQILDIFDNILFPILLLLPFFLVISFPMVIEGILSPGNSIERILTWFMFFLLLTALPMGLLFAGRFQSFGAWNPVFIVKSMFQTGSDYLMPLLIVMIIGVQICFVEGYVDINWVASMFYLPGSYLFFVLFRLLGRLYLLNQDSIG